MKLKVTREVHPNEHAHQFKFFIIYTKFVFYFALLWVSYMSILPMWFRVTVLTQVQSYDCPSASVEILKPLTHWGQVTHICIDKLTIIGSDNGLSPERHQAIIWTNAGVLLIGPLGIKFGEIVIEIYIFSFKKMHLKLSLGKWQTFCLSLNVLSN